MPFRPERVDQTLILCMDEAHRDGRDEGDAIEGMLRYTGGLTRAKRKYIENRLRALGYPKAADRVKARGGKWSKWLWPI
jgi:hypothetical protein